MSCLYGETHSHSGRTLNSAHISFEAQRATASLPVGVGLVVGGRDAADGRLGGAFPIPAGGSHSAHKVVGALTLVGNSRRF